MKLKNYIMAAFASAVTLLAGCTAEHPLANKVFSMEKDNSLVFIKFFDNGKYAFGLFSHADEIAEEQPYIWECINLDTASYRIEGNQVILSEPDGHIVQAPLNGSQLDLHTSADGKEVELSFKEDKRFKELRKTNKYAGTMYSCFTLSDEDVELLFVSDDVVIKREGDRGKDEIAPYQVTDDGAVIIKTKNRLELIPDKGSLKTEIWGNSCTFRKVDYKPTEFDAVEAKMIRVERERYEYERSMEILRGASKYR